MNVSGLRVDRFWESVPHPFLEALLHSLFACYAAADEDCDNRFGKTEKKNVQPFYRRGLFEGEMRSISKQFTETSAQAVLDEGGFWYHTRLICGHVILTQNAAGGPDQELRRSRYKSRYASAQNQLYLFDEGSMDDETLTYAVLTHGPSKESPIFPGFAVIRFPKPKLEGFYQGVIDLFEEFPEVIRANTVDLFSDEIRIDAPEDPVLLDDEEGTGTAG